MELRVMQNTLWRDVTVVPAEQSKENKSFDTSLVHGQADNLMVALDMKEFGNNKLTEMMSTPDKAKSEMYGIVVDMYETQNPAAYIKDMKKLAEHMMKDDDRSYEYQHMVKSVRVIANMKPEDLNTEKGKLARGILYHLKRNGWRQLRYVSNRNTNDEEYYANQGYTLY